MILVKISENCHILQEFLSQADVLLFHLDQVAALVSKSSFPVYDRRDCRGQKSVWQLRYWKETRHSFTKL